MKYRNILLLGVLIVATLATDEVVFDGKNFADWATHTAVEATDPGSEQQIEGITFEELTSGNNPGIETAEITPDPELPHYSLEFEYMGRGQIITWEPKEALKKVPYAMLPFRENWQIRGPTVFEYDMKRTGSHYQFVCAPKKLNVDDVAQNKQLHLDNMSVQFAPGFFSLDQYNNNNRKVLAQRNVKDPIGQFNNHRIYINPETDLLEITTSYSKEVLRAQYPKGYFASHPYCTFKTQVVQTFVFKSITVSGVNEYRMTRQTPWLAKRNEWKLQNVPTKFEWESDNRDCYFICNNQADGIDPNNGVWVIFYGWDNTKSEIRETGKTVVSSNHQLPTFKLGLFYQYSISINPESGVFTATSSAGLSFTHTFPNNYFIERPFCTFGVWSGMEGLTIRNVRRDAKEAAIVKNNFRGLKVGLLAGEQFYTLLSPQFELPIDEWVRISIRFSPDYALAIPAIESTAFQVTFADFGGDPTIEEIPVPGDFVIRRVVIQQTDEFYAVPANQLQNIFVTGFNVDYSTSGDPIEINLKTRTIQVVGGGSNSVMDGDVLVSAESAFGAISTSQDDILIGDERNNLFEGMAGADKIDGQEGSDTVSYLHANSGVEVSLERGRGYTGHAKGDELISIENVVGSEFDDILISTAKGGYLDGRDGTNTIVTGGGKDVVKLGAGVDTIHVHNSQKMLFVLDFEGDQDKIYLLGARNQDEILIEPYEKQNTIIQLEKSGGQIVLAGVLPDDLAEEAIVFMEQGSGTDKKCSETATLIDGRCMFNAPMGYFKHGNEIKECSDDGCQICNDDKCTACQNDHYNDSKLGCEPCDDKCKTCTGPKADNCSTCADGLVLKGSSCLEQPADCKDSEYLDPVKNACVKDETSCSKGYWGVDDGQGIKECIEDIGGSLKDAWVEKNQPKEDEKKKQVPKQSEDDENDDDNDAPHGDCPILFTECHYKGKAIEVCKPIPHLEESQIKSIYIPENFGKTVVLHKLPEFQGQTAQFQKSVDCLDTIDFHILEQLGININFDNEEEKANFFNNLNDNQMPSLSQIIMEDNDDMSPQVTLEAVEISSTEQTHPKVTRKLKQNQRV